MYTSIDSNVPYTSTYAPQQTADVTHLPISQPAPHQVTDLEVEALANSVYHDCQAKNQLFVLDQEFEKRYKAELHQASVSDKHWKMAKHHFRSMVQHTKNTSTPTSSEAWRTTSLGAAKYPHHPPQSSGSEESHPPPAASMHVQPSTSSFHHTNTNTCYHAPYPNNNMNNNQQAAGMYHQHQQHQHGHPPPTTTNAPPTTLPHMHPTDTTDGPGHQQPAGAPGHQQPAGGRFTIPAMRPNMKHVAKGGPGGRHAAASKALGTFLSMVQDASPNDRPPGVVQQQVVMPTGAGVAGGAAAVGGAVVGGGMAPASLPPSAAGASGGAQAHVVAKPPMHAPLPMMSAAAALAHPPPHPKGSAPPHTTSPPAPSSTTATKGFTDALTPLVQSVAMMAYEVQQERCALQQERDAVKQLLWELREERTEHRQLLLGLLQAFRAANTGAVKIVQQDVHRSAAVALMLAACMGGPGGGMQCGAGGGSTHPQQQHPQQQQQQGNMPR